MSPSAQRWGVGSSAVLIVVAALVWLNYRTSTYAARSSTRMARAAQRLARETLTVAPLADDASFTRAEAALVAAATAGVTDEREREALAGAVLTAIGLVRAWSSGDPDVYLAWARGHDMGLAPGLPFFGSWDRDKYAEFYEGVVGRPMPVGITMDRCFRDYYSAYFARWSGALRPASIAADPIAVIARVQPLTHWSEFVQTDAQIDASALGSEFWFGGITYSGMTLVWPRDTFPATDTDERTRVEGNRWIIGTLHDAKRLMFDAIIQKHGAVLAAEVHLVYGGGTGLYVPLTVWLRRRPGDGLWQTTGLAMSNVDGEVGVLPGYAYPPPY